nr:MAG TPA: hypothetical protein [Caudoviricetes sp.]
MFGSFQFVILLYFLCNVWLFRQLTCAYNRRTI